MSVRGWLRDPELRLPVLAGAGALGIAVLLGFLTESWTSAIMVGLTFFLAALAVVLVRALIQNERQRPLGSGLPSPQRLRPNEPVQPAVPAQPASSLEQQLKAIARDLRSRHGAGARAYEFPWLLVLGAPGSGKTRLIGASGLEVPARYVPPHPTPGDPEFVLSNEAVVIEAPGTWLVEGGDRARWHTLLQLLRKHRPRCPIHGVVVSVSVPWLVRSGARLDEPAHELRRRLNEARVELGVDAPVYVVLTQADALDGFCETAHLLPRSWLLQACGWTNDLRNLPDPGKSAGQAVDVLAERMDRLLPELLLRAPDPALQRALFAYPQELAALAAPLARFVGATFARDAYGRLAPFLRGVYLTSAQPQGASLSSTLARLGLATPPRQLSPDVAGPLFVRELVFEVIRDDHNLAVPDPRIGPVGRRAILGVAALASLWVVVVWGLSFAQNLSGTRELAALVEPVRSSRAPTLEELARLRERVVLERARAASPIQWLGLNRLADASERARSQYVRAFHASFDQDMQKRLAEKLRGENQDAVLAVLALSNDLRFLSEAGAGDPPDVAPYRPADVSDASAYQREYEGFVSLLSRQDAAKLLEERQPLRRTAETLLDLPLLEKITRDPASSLGPVRYEDVDLKSPSGRVTLVEGIYTPAGYAGLVDRLLGSSAARGGRESADDFKRRYLETYRSRWKAFLMDAPIVPRESEQIVNSPYVRLIELADAALRLPSDASGAGDDWVAQLQALRRTALLDGRSEKAADPPKESITDRLRRVWSDVRVSDPLGKEARWSLYRAQLQLVQDAVIAARNAGGPAALALANDVADKKETVFSTALAVVRRDVLPDPKTDFEHKLQSLLEAPILDAMSAVLGRAGGELDKTWTEKVQGPFGQGNLTAFQLGEMCAARDQFLQQDLGRFVGASGARSLPGGRGLHLGPAFVRWLESTRPVCGMVQAPASGSLVLQMRGESFKVEQPAGALARSTTLALSCASGRDSYEYKSGNLDHRFAWKSDCQEVVLSAEVKVDGRNVEIAAPTWRGPLAVPDFLRAGRLRPSERGARTEVREWRIEQNGIVVDVAYTILSGTDLAGIQYSVPPRSLGL